MKLYSKSSRCFIGMVCLVLSVFSFNTFAFQVDVSEAPTNDLALTVSAIQSAKQSLMINIYELTSPEVVNAILERINAGVHVEVLEEGQPVGGFSAAAQLAQNQLVRAMVNIKKNDHLYAMSSKAGGKRRFRFDHAKYIVIDGHSLLIGSENYTPTGQPREGVLGNRGWEVWIHEGGLAQEFSSMFYQDCDSSKGDILDKTQGTEASILPFPPSFLFPVFGDEQPQPENLSVSHPLSFEVASAFKITSPETSLSGLVSLLGQAKSNIDVELMNFDLNWGTDRATTSPLFVGIRDAARRGVRVRVLLNDESVFTHQHTNSKNQITVDALNQITVREHLNVTARIANVKAMKVDYIHNKGIIIDDDKTLISSINWGKNSVENNREAAVVLMSRDVHAHYQDLFDQDWKAE